MNAPAQKPVTLYVYKTNVGTFLKKIDQYSFNPDRYRINGVRLSMLIKNDPGAEFLHLPDVEEINEFQTIKPASKVLHYYQLMNPDLASAVIPVKLNPETVEQYYDDGYYRWKNFDHIRALYTEVHRDVPESWVDTPFEVNVLRELEIENFEAPVVMKVKFISKNGWDEKVYETDLSKLVSYDEWEKMLTPEFLLHNRPCILSSKQVYDIVRHHVKTNINPRYADITSDYAFCFTVKRKVAIKPYVRSTEIKNQRGKSFARPKFKTQTVEHKLVELFEMTHAQENYRGYTPIAGWRADNLRDMAEQITNYLSNLMDEINKPVVECDHCKGTGHLVGPKIETNRR